MEQRLRVPFSELGPEQRVVVEHAGRSIALFVEDGVPYAVDNACPHEGNPLVLGRVAGGVVTCAFHLWRFELATGACLHGDAPVRRYPSVVENGEIVIDLVP